MANHATMMMCEQCGTTTRKTAGNQKYCPDCRRIVRREKVRANVSRHWYRRKENPVEEIVEVQPTSWDGLLMGIVKQALLDYSTSKHRADARGWLLDRGQDFVLASGSNENIEDMMEAIDNDRQ